MIIAGRKVDIASRGARLAGWVIDVAVGLVFISITVSMTSFLVEDYYFSNKIINGFILIGVLYIIFADITNGQGIGKRVMNIAVIDSKTCYRAFPGQIFARCLIRASLGWLDLIFLLSDSKQLKRHPPKEK